MIWQSEYGFSVMEAKMAGDDRYSRQILFAPIGEAGQHSIGQARVLVVGCGALGSAILETLARAGTGMLRMVDRDYVEESNLQRQCLYTEEHARLKWPKAVAAAAVLRSINSGIRYEPEVADFNHLNAAGLADGIDLILDGTDNFEARQLMNEIAVKQGIPYVYGACVAGSGVVMPVIPGRTPCLKCIMPELPVPGSVPTCDTEGIIGPAVRMVAALETALALRILTGGGPRIPPVMLQLDCWELEAVRMDVANARQDGCAVCGRREFELLEGRGVSRTVVMCGRNMVQIQFPPDAATAESGGLDLAELARRLEASGTVSWNGFLLSFSAPPYELILFPDGRCLVKGTADAAEARGLFARYIGM